MRRYAGQSSYLLAMCAACILPCAAARGQGSLLNGGFEANGGSLSNWDEFNNTSVPSNVSAASITPRTGSYVAKMFGAFNGEPNYSGLLQSVPASPGDTWQAIAYSRHNPGDSLAGTGSHLLMKIEFYSVPGGSYGTSEMLGENGVVILDGDSPQGLWNYGSLSAAAPAGTVEARIALVFVQVGYAAGAVLIDDVILTNGTLPPEPSWQLIWQDEFDGPGIDGSKWRVEDLHLIKNNEQQYYAPDDVYIENGSLVLRSQERPYQGYDSDGGWGSYDYTSGLVESQDRFATTYGKIEIRAKMPSTQGIWPALWTLPTSGAWPPEIDIMELLGHEPTKVYMTHHWGSWPNVASHGGSLTGPDFSQDYHVYTLEWLPDKLDWYVDGVRRFTSAVAVPQEPFYIILNTAVGGFWPGYPDGTTVFPQYHEIDYVRVYMPVGLGGPVSEIIDTTPESAQVDGVIAPGEYVGSIAGINTGFGDRIGQDSELLVDSGGAGRLNFAFQSATAWPSSPSEGVVIYVDSVEGGFASTYELNDVSDVQRSLASGKGLADERSDLYFAPGFLADFAVVVQSDSSVIYELGKSSHTLVNGAELGAPTDMLGGRDVTYRIDDGSFGLQIRELGVRLAHLDVEQGDAFDFVATLGNGSSAFRSNEFVGVAAGNDWDTGNVGAEPAVLKIGDYVRFQSAPWQPADIPAVSTWGMVVLTLVLMTAGTVLVGRRGKQSAERCLV